MKKMVKNGAACLLAGIVLAENSLPAAAASEPENFSPGISRYEESQTTSRKGSANKKITSIKPESKVIRLAIGKKYTPKIQVLPSNATNRRLKYQTSRPSMVSVDSEGNLWAKKQGSSVITCTAGDGSGKKASFTVIVKHYASDIRILNAPSTMTVGEQVTLRTRTIPSNAMNKEIFLQSSNPKVISVTENGTLKAIRPGKAKVVCRAKYGAGTTKVLSITVCPNAPTFHAKTAKGAVTLTWEQPVGAKLCSVYWASGPNETFQRLYRGRETTFTKKGLAAGKTYYFKLCCAAFVDQTYVTSPFSEVLTVKVR